MAALLDPVLEHPKLVSDLMDRSGGFLLAKICNVLGVEKSGFAVLTHRRVESVAKLFSEKSFKPRNSTTIKIIKELVQLIGILRSMGLEEDAARWMNAPLPSYDGKSPFELVASGQGQKLISRLLSLAQGNIGG
jgi:uncharacterized protein (DUF2384 family)